jgi:translation elongation factor EF-G
MKKLIIAFSLFSFFNSPLLAENCLQYKISPNVKVIKTKWVQKVVQPDQPMDSLGFARHGTVETGSEEKYDLQVYTIASENGYCVQLNSLSATLGYTGFQINIRKSYTPDSCEYKVILDHENEHVSAYIKALDNESENIKKAIHLAADSIIPVFVPSLDGVSAALDKIKQEFQSHPEIILMKQKLDAQQEILNKKVDEHDDGRRIYLCK